MRTRARAGAVRARLRLGVAARGKNQLIIMIMTYVDLQGLRMRRIDVRARRFMIMISVRACRMPVRMQRSLA